MILKSLFFLSGIFLISKAYSQSTPEIWRNILKENSECVTWVSASVRIEISSNGRSYPPSERNIEALGTEQVRVGPHGRKGENQLVLVVLDIATRGVVLRHEEQSSLPGAQSRHRE